MRTIDLQGYFRFRHGARVLRGTRVRRRALTSVLLATLTSMPHTRDDVTHCLAKLNVDDAVQHEVDGEVYQQENVRDHGRHLECGVAYGIDQPGKDDEIRWRYKNGEEDDECDEGRGNTVTRIVGLVGAVQRLHAIGSPEGTDETDVADGEDDEWDEDGYDGAEETVAEDELVVAVEPVGRLRMEPTGAVMGYRT